MFLLKSRNCTGQWCKSKNIPRQTRGKRHPLDSYLMWTSKSQSRLQFNYPVILTDGLIHVKVLERLDIHVATRRDSLALTRKIS
uniref:Uncharacterized protein n=1 Tax=Rhizophora mucronata TaxID=61149 RepID=A0A2P2NN58_RHIMU